MKKSANIKGSWQNRLLGWYDQNRRDLPWRRHRQNAYYQWLAEIMLQQTQVAVVVPYFERFVARFPNVVALAGADLDEVLKLWSGLGYYARARNLHRTAGIVVERWAGQFPAASAELRRLPGVGRYTAGAIASIAFGERCPVLDGNVKRVLSRMFWIDQDIKRASTLKKMWTLAGDILPPNRCGDFNQALMELGSTI